MNEIAAILVGLEFAIGVCVTFWFVIRKIVLPVIEFIGDYLRDYDEFKKWRKRNR